LHHSLERSAAILSVSIFPQMIRIWRRGAAGISYPGTVAVTAVDILWASWSIGTGLLAPSISDSIGAACSVTVLMLVVRDQGRHKLVAAAGVTALTLLGVGLGALIPLVAGVFAFSLSFLWRTLQLREVVRSPDISGVSASMWLLNCVGLTSWSLHGFAIENTFLLYSSAVLAAYALIIVVTITTKRRNRPDSQQHEGIFLAGR
jgi:uncharacterized protein with PQ loop repeat